MVAPVRYQNRPLEVGQDDAFVRLRFGGGLHTRASEDEINEREAHDGQNFILDADNTEHRNRPPFDKVGTAPNGAEVRGFITLVKRDGAVKFGVQAGGNVYEWDGKSTFTAIGSVNSSARLRGRLEHFWQLDDKVLITDLDLKEQVLEWDGSTFQNTSFTDENGSGFGDFYAKYCYIAGERAVFGNVRDASQTTGHLIVGSKVSDYTQITVANKPSSALANDDPFFLVTPDTRAINGLVQAFNTTAVSTENGNFFKLTGQDATDFAFDELFPRSGAKGDESVVYVGNDVMYGRQGRIESLKDTDRSGDTAANDLSFWVSDQIKGFDGWTSVHNARLDRVYFFPDGQSEVWVLQKDLLDVGSDVSPWSKWVTEHSLGFQPTAVMNMIDPDNGLEYVFMGDSSGNIYRLEGSGTSGDGGSQKIRVARTSALFRAPLNAEIVDVTGWIRYRKDQDVDASLTFYYAGTQVSQDTITLTLAGAGDRPVYGGDLYYNDGNYYTSLVAGRLVRQPLGVAGQAESLQVRLTISGTTDFRINEIGLRFKAAS